MQRAYARWLAHGIPRWPTLKIVFAILAGGVPVQIERLQARGFDISAALWPTIYLETASYGRRALDHCLSMFGASHVVFGSDAPVVPTDRGSPTSGASAKLQPTRCPARTLQGCST